MSFASSFTRYSLVKNRKKVLQLGPSAKEEILWRQAKRAAYGIGRRVAML
jgi:hypothetical protein